MKVKKKLFLGAVTGVMIKSTLDLSLVVIGIRALGAVLAAVVTALNQLIGASLALGLWCP